MILRSLGEKRGPRKEYRAQMLYHNLKRNPETEPRIKLKEKKAKAVWPRYEDQKARSTGQLLVKSLSRIILIICQLKDQSLEISKKVFR